MTENIPGAPGQPERPQQSAENPVRRGTPPPVPSVIEAGLSESVAESAPVKPAASTSEQVEGSDPATVAPAAPAGTGQGSPWAPSQPPPGQPVPGDTRAFQDQPPPARPWQGPTGSYPPSQPGQQAVYPAGSPSQPGFVGPPPHNLGAGHPYAEQPHAARTPPRRSGRGWLVAGAAVLVLLVGGVAGGVGGYVGYRAGVGSGTVVNALDQPPPSARNASTPPGTVQAAAQKALPSVVDIKVSGGGQGGEGSGFVISSDGQIITNNHVVDLARHGGRIAVAFHDGRTVSADIIGTDPTTDVAVIKAQGVSALTPISLGRSGDLAVGQEVVAVGSPFQLPGTVTAGIVSALNRPVTSGDGSGDTATTTSAIQTDAPINPGNSGGPLLDLQGNVIGINSSIYSPNSTRGTQGGSVGLGFAIPIDQARRIADQLVKDGKANHAQLGVNLTRDQSGQADQTSNGAGVSSVAPGGAADRAGLKAGDVITKVDNTPTPTGESLVAAVRSRAPGDKVTLTLSGGRTVEATLGSD